MFRHKIKIKTITAILIAACMATAADIEQFVFQVTTTASNRTFAIPLSGNLNGNYTKAYNWTIDWGDDRKETSNNLQGGNANSPGIYHIYANAGTYTITIKPAGSTSAWLGAFGFANNTNGANAQANKNMVGAIISPLTPLMTRTQTQLDNGTAPSNEWAYTFIGCQNLTMGEGFTFSESWNSITTVGNSFANDMFSGVSGSSFTMNSVFNLPQEITSVGVNFAGYMFSYVIGNSFKVNDVFKFPALSQAELNKIGVFYQTFYNTSAISTTAQTRTAASIINNTLVPSSNIETFTNNNRFLDRDYIATQYGGGGNTAAVIAITTHPAPTTNLTFGSISGELSANASIAIALPIAYQWHSNTENSNEGGTPIEDATDAAFEIPADLTAGTHYFYCVASTKDGAYPVVSDVATINVSKTPLAKPTLAKTTFNYDGTAKTSTPEPQLEPLP